jgi:hypothetical protein
MDRTRHKYGNDLDPGNGKQTVTYRHFVVSPDPKDGCDLETLRSLTMEWVHKYYGDFETGKPGLYGFGQVAVVYHDDNEHHIPHAHIIVNNTNLADGYRLKQDKDDLLMMHNSLQDMAARRGLSTQEKYTSPTSHKGLHTRARYVTKTERNLKRSGRFSWKQDIADRVDVARRAHPLDESAFLSRLSRLGIQASLDAGGDYLFKDQRNPIRWQVSGFRIGKTYSRDSYLTTRDEQVAGIRRELDNVASNLRSFLDSFERVQAARIEAARELDGERAASTKEPQPTKAEKQDMASSDTQFYKPVSAVAEAVRFCERNHIHVPADIDRYMKTLAIKIKKAEAAGSERLEDYRGQYAEVAKVKKTVQRRGLLVGNTDINAIADARLRSAPDIKDGARSGKGTSDTGPNRTLGKQQPSKGKSR